jgi:hypothetical protein
MNGIDKLIGCAGEWVGLNRVQVTAGDPVNESASRLVVTPMLRGTFVRFDQTWSWKEEAQVGSMLIGYDPKTDSASIQWIDTWHNRRKVMALTGGFDGHGELIVHGHFAVESGPDWGWRIEVGMRDERLNVDMFCVEPGGKDDGGAWASFARA